MVAICLPVFLFSYRDWLAQMSIVKGSSSSVSSSPLRTPRCKPLFTLCTHAGGSCERQPLKKKRLFTYQSRITRFVLESPVGSVFSSPGEPPPGSGRRARAVTVLPLSCLLRHPRTVLAYSAGPSSRMRRLSDAVRDRKAPSAASCPHTPLLRICEPFPHQPPRKRQKPY